MATDSTPSCAYAVKASGDAVGNNGTVEVYRCSDGTARLSVHNARGSTTVWLLPGQSVSLATALLVAAKADYPASPEVAPDVASGRPE